MSDPASYAVVVLAGGTSRRMGGGDKTALELGAGRSVLGHLVGSLEPSVPVVVVGTRRPLERLVHWGRERPIGGGPVAGLAAGLSTLAQLPGPASEWIAVLAGDLPFARPGLDLLLARRAAVGSAVDGLIGVDGAGRDQPLLGLYRRAALAEALGSAAVPGRSMRSVLHQMVLERTELPAAATLDVDRPADLERARALLGSRA